MRETKSYTKNASAITLNVLYMIKMSVCNLKHPQHVQAQCHQLSANILQSFRFASRHLHNWKGVFKQLSSSCLLVMVCH